MEGGRSRVNREDRECVGKAPPRRRRLRIVEDEGEEGAASEYDQPRGKQAGDPEIKREEGGETKERMGRKEEKKGLHSAKNHAAAEEGKRSVGWVGGSTNTHTHERIPGRSRRRFSFPPPSPRWWGCFLTKIFLPFDEKLF